jgi:trk system potassium uptake protein TrkH
MKARAHMSRLGMEGALLVLSPLPLLLASLGNQTAIVNSWRLWAAAFAAIACFSSALSLFRHPPLGKFLGTIAALCCYAAACPAFIRDPFAALAGTVGLIAILFSLTTFRIKINAETRQDHAERCRQRACWGAAALLFVVIFDLLTSTSVKVSSFYVLAGAAFMAQGLYLHWAVKGSTLQLLVPAAGVTSLGWALFFLPPPAMPALALLIGVVSLILIFRQNLMLDTREHWWEFLFNHPARILITTFLSLCVLGTVLLSFPASTTSGAIDLLDAAFTSVSAVCVTGLIVLDTPHDFTLFGQFAILLLIQLGGLGIMSITTVALHAMGRRLSLKQERLLTSMTDTDHRDLVHSLAVILKFTFIAEGMGALVLALLFSGAGDTFPQALWRGVFTAISAFCNAGFALQSDSLISYQTQPFLLQTVSLLIVLGGLAPATSLIIPRWLAGKKVPIPAHIALVTTAILLISGTFLLMAFEWNGFLAGLSFGDKVANAWFQSATLRTAGFNSVEMAGLAGPTYLIMIAFMFIGGSPGGTAGGVKTTTIGILALTFWTNITSRHEVITQNRRVHHTTIYRAVTVIASGAVVWFVVVLMLGITQPIPVLDLIFEATSAIGTVGLSIGATALLDEIGKVIVIIAMFAGRIGPMTLFMLLSDDHVTADIRYPVQKISIT